MLSVEIRQSLQTFIINSSIEFRIYQLKVPLKNKTTKKKNIQNDSHLTNPHQICTHAWTDKQSVLGVDGGWGLGADHFRWEVMFGMH